MRPRPLNGQRIAAWVPVPAPYPPAPVPPAPPTRLGPPRCPKHCDTATPPEPAAGVHRFVCVCCGTEFTWKGQPS